MVVYFSTTPAGAKIRFSDRIGFRPIGRAISWAGGLSGIASDGTLLGTIEIGSPTFNVVWGENGQTIALVYRLCLTTSGAQD